MLLGNIDDITTDHIKLALWVWQAYTSEYRGGGGRGGFKSAVFRNVIYFVPRPLFHCVLAWFLQEVSSIQQIYAPVLLLIYKENFLTISANKYVLQVLVNIRKENNSKYYCVSKESIIHHQLMLINITSPQLLCLHSECRTTLKNRDFWFLRNKSCTLIMHISICEVKFTYWWLVKIVFNNVPLYD